MVSLNLGVGFAAVNYGVAKFASFVFSDSASDEDKVNVKTHASLDRLSRKYREVHLLGNN